MAADVVSATNQKLLSAVSNVDIMNTIGWIVFILVAIGAGFWGYLSWRDKRLFNKKITVFEIVGIHYTPGIRDTAKVVKLGTGGFEILYLKKTKCYRIAFGGKVGKDTYYFFVQPDGYWYNGMLSANMHAVDKNGGLIPIVTTNPSMRAQYTALEKQIDSLHSEKKSFMDKYGSWIMGIGFVLIVGVLAWLIFKEMSPMFGQISTLTEKLGTLVDKINSVASNMDCKTATNSGLVPV